MKLGSQTSSLTNHLYSRMVKGQPVPTVGMGATILSWTDRHGATIVDVRKAGQYIAVTRDDCKRTDNNGMSEDQTYSYTTRPDGAKQWYKRETDGRWSEVIFNPNTGRFKKTGGAGLRLGVRDSYHDYSF